MRRRYLMTGLALTTLLTSSAALAADNPAVGRWDLTIMVSPEYKAPSWLEIREQDGKFLGRLCGEAAGVQDIGEVKVDGDKLEFKSDLVGQPDKYFLSYTATIKNNTVRGTRTVAKDLKHPWMRYPSETKHPFIGLKFMPTADPGGEWKMKLGDDQADLSLKRAGRGPATAAAGRPGEITGKMSGKHAGEVTNASLKGNRIELAVKTGEKTGKLEGAIKGDITEGTFDAGDGKPVKFTARRERKWGEPIKLFNGKDLDGWETMDPPGEKAENKWTVIDGVMVSTGGGRNIRTKRTFKDFKLHAEFRVPPGSNSGVYLRGRYEIQVKDSFERPLSGDSCGALYSRITPSVNAAKPAGEWQTFDITLVGQYVTVAHNGKTIIDNHEIEGITGGAIDSNEFAAGPIYFQGDHGKIEYRSVVLTPAE